MTIPLWSISSFSLQSTTAPFSLGMIFFFSICLTPLGFCWLRTLNPSFSAFWSRLQILSIVVRLHCLIAGRPRKPIRCHRLSMGEESKNSLDQIKQGMNPHLGTIQYNQKPQRKRREIHEWDSLFLVRRNTKGIQTHAFRYRSKLPCYARGRIAILIRYTRFENGRSHKGSTVVFYLLILSFTALFWIQICAA